MLMVCPWQNEERLNGYGELCANMLGLTAFAPDAAETAPLCCSAKLWGQLVGICPVHG